MLVRLLMTLPKPSKRVKEAVHGAMKWFDTYKLTGLKLVRTGWRPGERRDAKLVEDATAKLPIWGRFYNFEYCEPFVCDRDGIQRRRLEQIGLERRTGYSWYGSRPAELYPLYEKWAEANDPKNKVQIDLHAKGANENGLIEMYRRPTIDRAAFDVVVKAGESIALVGPTGVGKTTLTQLISRFYEPTHGRILIDGQDLQKITLESLRRNISPVLQDTFLFHGSIADNIGYAKPDATREEIMAAAKAANIHEDIFRHADIIQFNSSLEYVYHTSSRNRNLSAVHYRAVDNLLDSVNVAGEGSNDNTLALSV